MTCFSDSEEAAVGMADAVPYLLQKRMTELGALVSVGADWTSNVVVDGKIVTGQVRPYTRRGVHRVHRAFEFV